MNSKHHAMCPHQGAFRVAVDNARPLPATDDARSL
jgi:hypothetical protein